MTAYPPITENADDPDVCEEHGVEFVWTDDGRTDYGPNEPYLTCLACEDEAVGIGLEVPCYDCTRAAGLPVDDDSACVQRRIAALGPVVNDPFDPTQSYRLECGHVTI